MDHGVGSYSGKWHELTHIKEQELTQKQVLMLKVCEKPAVEREFKWLTSEDEPDDNNSDWTP